MLTLSTPSALLALLGLLVPLAIHLWNRRPGREVAVGSLRWLAAGANRRLRNLRLEQLGLLLLRAALLAGLAVAVAGPVWWQPRRASRGQVLVSPALAGTAALATMRPVIDSLRRQGYALRALSRGLPLLPASAWRADSLKPPAAAASETALADTAEFYEARIWQAADSFPGQPLYVLTPARLAAMRGTRHPLPAGLTWQTLPLGAESTWLQAATGITDSLVLLLGRSTERQTVFQTVRVARPQPGQAVAGPGAPALRYELSAQGQPQVRPLSTGNGPLLAAVPVRPARVRVWVYATPPYATDARYLRAALRAASVGLPGPLALTIAPTLPDTAAAPDWLFWLADAPVSAAWRGRVRRGLHLWQPVTGAGIPDTTLLVAPELLAAAPVTLWRHAPLPVAGAEPIWMDAQGRTVLTRQAIGRGAVYQAAVRLNTAWSTLPANAALPALLLGVLRPALSGPELARFQAHDQRRLDPAQLPAPRRRAVGAGRPVAGLRLLDLRPWLVLAVGLLLALERWVARRASVITIPTT